jgi:hypothetical protein
LLVSCDRLLEALEPFFMESSPTIQTGALAKDSDEDTIMDLISYALSEQSIRRDRINKNERRTDRMRAKAASGDAAQSPT